MSWRSASKVYSLHINYPISRALMNDKASPKDGKHANGRPQNRSALKTTKLHAELLNLLTKGISVDEILRLQKRGENFISDQGERSVLSSSIKAALIIQQQQAVQLQRENGLLTILETAQDLTTLRDLDLVLETIVRRARRIFSSDIGYLTHYDRVQNDFYIRATDGAHSEKFKKVRVPPEHGICGYILRNKAPYHCTNYMQDSGFLHDDGIDHAIMDEGVCSLLGAPLMVGNHCIGILCVCDRKPRSHEPWEISMLSTLAAQAAIAIENARLFQESQVSLTQASEANARLHQQAEAISHAAEAHEQMTKLAASGGTVQDIIKLMTVLIGGEVALINEAEKITYHAATDQNAQDNTAPTTRTNIHKLFEKMDIQDKVHHAISASRSLGASQTFNIDRHGNKYITVSAIIGADRLLGALVLLTDTKIIETKLRTFERGALVASVALLSAERDKFTLSSRSIAALRALVNRQQEPIDILRSITNPLGLDVDSPLRMMVVLTEESRTDWLVHRAKPQLHSSTLIEPIDGLVVAIYQSEHAESTENTLKSIIDTGSRVRAFGVYSYDISDISKLPSQFRSLKRCTNMLKALSQESNLVPESLLNMYAILFEQYDSNDLEVFLEDTIGALIGYDEKRNTNLCNTLLTYLDEMQSMKRAAHLLDIHINTLRQRLETIDQQLGSWRTGNKSLETHVALRMHSMRQSLSENRSIH